MNKEHTKLKKLAVRTPEERQAAEQKRTTAVMGALKAVHSATSPDSMEPEDLERQRKGQELLGRLIAPMVGLSWEPFDLEGMPAAWARPERQAPCGFILPWRRLYQRQSGLFPYSGL